MNQKIIDAVIRKAEKVCPDSLALIGIYGSVATGDGHAKSDLDLLILIENEEGRKLATGFILDDSGVGYDIYCTDRDNLYQEAQCHHAYLSKLMDSKIVYVKNQDVYNELCKLREDTKLFLESDERYQRVNELITKAKTEYADALLCDTLGRVRLKAFGVIDCLLNAVMLYHGKYFRLGVKRTFDEIANLPVAHEFSDNMRKIAVSNDVCEIRDLLKSLLFLRELMRKCIPTGEIKSSRLLITVMYTPPLSICAVLIICFLIFQHSLISETTILWMNTILRTSRII